MRTFEQFIAEADEMGLQSRLTSGQINPQQARVLQQRRTARAKVSTPTTEPTKPSGSAKPISGTTARPALPGSTSSYKPQPVLKANNDLGSGPVKRAPIPNHLALSTKVKDPKTSEIQQQRDKILGNNNNRSDVRFRKGLAANARGAGNLVKKIGSQLLKKQEAPKQKVSVSGQLSGPQKFGPETR